LLFGDHARRQGLRWLVDGRQDPTRQGVAIEAFFYAEAKVHHNTVVASPGGVKAFDNSTITER